MNTPESPKVSAKPAKPVKTEASEKLRRAKGFIRWRGVAFLLGSGVFFSLYSVLYFDAHLAALLEKMATDLNSAKVDNGTLKTSFFKRTLEIRNLQITHHANPMRNLVEVDRIAFQFGFEPLFRKKVIIENLVVQGVHYSTQRRESGYIEPVTNGNYVPPSFIDRVASGLYAGIRSELNDNPLKFLGQLTTGLNIKGKLEGMRKDYSTERILAENKVRLNTLVQEWDKLKYELPTDSEISQLQQRIAKAYNEQGTIDSLSAAEAVRREIAEKQAAAADKVNRAKGQALALQEKLKNVSELVEDDVARVRRTLGLPRTDFEDLSPQIFGPRILGYSERLSYVVDLSRRRMPEGTVKGPVSLVVQQRRRGSSIHFGRRAGNPMFLVKEAFIESDIGKDPTLGKVSGYISGITSDPSIYGHPAKFDIEASFPSAFIQDVKFTAVIDHTGDKFKESFRLSVKSMPLEDWGLSATSDLGFKVKRGIASGTMSANFIDENLNGEWKMHVENAEYATASIYKQAEEIVRGIVTPVFAFDLEGSVGGSFEKLKFACTSVLGQKLAEGLKREYRHQLGAIDDNLKKNILDQIEPQRLEFNYRFDEAREKYVEPLQARLSQLQNLSDLADKTVSRLEKTRKRSVGRRITGSPSK